MKSMINLIFKLFLVAGVIMFVVTAALLVNANNKRNKFEACKGTIVDFYENTSELRVDSYESKAVSPVISYSVNGQTYQFIGNYYSTTMKLGQEVEVMYDKADASKATIKKGVFLAPIITGAITAVFLLLYIIYAVLKSKGLINF